MGRDVFRSGAVWGRARRRYAHRRASLSLRRSAHRGFEIQRPFQRGASHGVVRRTLDTDDVCEHRETDSSGEMGRWKKPETTRCFVSTEQNGFSIGSHTGNGSTRASYVHTHSRTHSLTHARTHIQIEKRTDERERERLEQVRNRNDGDRTSTSDGQLEKLI